MPPTPPGYKPVKAARTAPVPLLSAPRTIIYTPQMTNVLTIREAYTNSVVWTNLSKTNLTMGWRTNKVVTGVVVSYPTNAWDYALQWSPNLTSRWVNVRFNDTNTGWRVTNGQWFDVTRPIGPNLMTFYRLSKAAYGARLIWDSHPESNVLSGFKVYYGASSRVYESSFFTTHSNALREARENATYGYALSNLNVNAKYFMAVTALDTNGLESDFSNEVLLPKMTE